MELGGVAVAEVAEEIDLPLAVGKEFGGDKAGEKQIPHRSKCDGIRNDIETGESRPKKAGSREHRNTVLMSDLKVRPPKGGSETAANAAG